MKIFLARSCLSALCLLSGCATMTSGGTQQVSFQSVPDDVVVTLTRDIPNPETYPNNRSVRPDPPKPKQQETRILGKTPVTLQLDRADGQTVTLSKTGYASVTMPLTTEINSAVWGNIFIGGFFGTTTDTVSGAIYEYVPNQYVITLIPEHATMIEQSAGQPQRDRALAFIVRRYPDLMANLSQRSGEDWRALVVLLHIGPGHEEEARQKIGALSMVYPDAAVFAAHVTDLYLKQ